MFVPQQVRTRQDLLYLLSRAAELEHSLSCQYLFAAFSLKEQGDEGVSDGQAAVIRKWRATLMHVAIEEMLHLGIACNLLEAIGGAPYLSRASFPQLRTYSSLNLDFRLAPLTPATVRRFACFEAPSRLPEDSKYRSFPVGDEKIDWIAECDLLKCGCGRWTKTAEPLLPDNFDYGSIGRLYELIEEGFETLYPGDEAALFIGSPEAQSVGMWKQMTSVRSREDAKRAIQAILEQGEGAGGDDDDIDRAHFGHIAKIFAELVEGKGGAAPAFDVIENPVFTKPHDITVDLMTDGKPERVRANLLTADVARRANEIFISVYELALQVLARYFAAAGESEEQLYILKQTFLSLMRFCLTPLGMAICRLPAYAEQEDGPRAGPSFELYSDVALLPQLHGSWRYFEERLAELAKASEALAKSPVSDGHPALRRALLGSMNAPANPGLVQVLQQYETLVKVGLEPPSKWTWDNGIRAFFSPLDILRMGTWLAREDSVRAQIDKVVLRITGTGGATPMPPDKLLGDLEAPENLRNPEGPWTSERINSFLSWAAEAKPAAGFECPSSPTWWNSIRELFTEGDALCMGQVTGIRLGSYESVKAHAQQISLAVRSGSMPPGKPWTNAQCDCFDAWIDLCCPEGLEPKQMYAWRTTSSPRASVRYDDIWFTDADTGWAVNSNGQILHTTDGGRTWDEQFQTPILPSGWAIYLSCIGMANARRGWVGTVSEEHVLYETRDGKTWSVVDNLPEPGPAKVCGISVVNERVVYCSGTNEPSDPPRIMKTLNGGTTWQVIDMSPWASLLVDCHFWNQSVGMVVGGISMTSEEIPSRNDVKAAILFTEDGGATWQNRTANLLDDLPFGEWGWKIQWLNDRIGFVALESFTQGAIAKTVDGGATWVRQTINDPQNNVNLEGIGFLDENVGWVGGWGNVTLDGGFTSATYDGGRTWWDANHVGAFINRFRFIRTDDQIVGYACGRHVYKMTYHPDGEPPDEVDEPAAQGHQLLATNEPASCEGEVEIRIDVPEGRSRITLILWDRFRTRKAMLLDEFDPSPGPRTVVWNGTDDCGNSVPPGVFIYRVSTDKETHSRIIAYSPGQ